MRAVDTHAKHSMDDDILRTYKARTGKEFPLPGHPSLQDDTVRDEIMARLDLLGRGLKAILEVKKKAKAAKIEADQAEARYKDYKETVAKSGWKAQQTAQPYLEDYKSEAQALVGEYERLTGLEEQLKEGVRGRLATIEDEVLELLGPDTGAATLRAQASREVALRQMDPTREPSVRPPVSIPEDGSVLFLSMGPTNYPESVADRLSPGVTYSYHRQYAQVVPGPGSSLGELSWSRWENSPMRGGSNELGRDEPYVYVLRGSEITKGLVEYIVGAFWENVGYADAMIGAFVPQNEPAEWEPMRYGELNCFVEATLPDYTGKNTKKPRRGRADPVKTLMDFNKMFIATGVQPSDVWALEKVLDAKIYFHDINGNVVAESGLPAGHRKVLRYVRHNGHCDRMDRMPQFPPPECRQEPLVMNLVYPPVKDEELRKQKDLALTLRFLRMNGIFPKPGKRAWFVKNEVITSDGEICRRYLLQEELRAAAGAEGVDFNEVKKSIGGVQAFRFKCWAKRNGLRRAVPNHVAWLEKAQVEPRVWNCEHRYDLKHCYEEDMARAYLGCEDPALGRAKSAAEPYIRRFRMPHADKGMAWYSVRDLSQVENLPGSFVRFASWRLAGHGYLSVFEDHLRKSGGLMPTPLALALRDLGYLPEHELHSVALSFEPAPLLQFLDANASEENKRLSHRFVGSCVQKPRNSIVVCDKEEAKYHYNLLMRKGACPTMTLANGFGWESGAWLIEYTDLDTKVKYPHVRAYVLAYLHIAVLAKLKEHPDAVRVATDSITVPGSAPLCDCPNSVPWGSWRAKTNPRPWAEFYWHPLKGDIGEGYTAGKYPELPEELFESPLIYLDGMGGAGKTTRAVRALSGMRGAVLGKDWLGVLDLQEKVGKAAADGLDMSRVSVHTYHQFWHIGFAEEKCEAKCGKCLACTGWLPERMGDASKAGALPDAVVWDEIGFVPGPFLRPILEYCLEQRVRVIATADILGQVRQFRDRGRGDPLNHRILVDLGAKVVFHAGDRRAKCLKLRALKERMWRSSEEDQLREVASAIGCKSLEQALEAWHPNSHFAVCTNYDGRVTIQDKLLAEHEKRFPDHPVPMRFKPSKAVRARMKPGSLVPVPGLLIDEAEEVPAVVGTRVWIRPEDALYYLRTEKSPMWVYDGWRTIHSLQGLTIGCPDPAVATEYSLFIYMRGLGSDWNKNSTFTAVSRVEYLAQLALVS